MDHKGLTNRFLSHCPVMGWVRQLKLQARGIPDQGKGEAGIIQLTKGDNWVGQPKAIVQEAVQRIDGPANPEQGIQIHYRKNTEGCSTSYFQQLADPIEDYFYLCC